MNRSTNATPHDAALRAAIAAAADVLRFDNRPGSVARQCTLGLFVAALSDRLALAFPQSADALKAIVFSPPTSGNPTQSPLQQPEQQQ
ncbi:hypothetical protein WI72_11680 [Burkholderia ubonensis]|uniref:hypothetical protein n=1 Tax=Burkholderia ubonensis TaxID=101571 RepID=UPI00075A8FB2|nr:hypothetical protein [Burkholderia ubonensis]KVC61869.1 hypothetical protein WI72_11680 [Burkholderia ubonensis]